MGTKLPSSVSEGSREGTQQSFGFAKWECKSGARAELRRTLEGGVALSCPHPRAQASL